jgi:hypothetical protein
MLTLRKVEWICSLQDLTTLSRRAKVKTTSSENGQELDISQELGVLHQV